jgi:hypothetical protein
MFKCPKCDYETNNLNSLRIHTAKRHALSSEELYLAVISSDGVRPTCKCGCGEPTKFITLQKGYSEFILGHAARVNNNWGHNQAAFEKSLETRRKMWESGEIKGWCAGLTKDDPRVAAIIEKMNTPERAKKISTSLTGKSKSEEHRKKISENMSVYWGKEENRARQSLRQAECVKNGMLTKATRIHDYYDNPKKSSSSTLYYRSLFELNVINHLENSSDVVKYAFEPYRIEYLHDDKMRNYVIDCLIEYQDGRKVIVEIKPSCHLLHPKNQAKFYAAEIFARKNGYLFEIWTEKTHSFLSSKLPGPKQI